MFAVLLILVVLSVAAATYFAFSCLKFKKQFRLLQQKIHVYKNQKRFVEHAASEKSKESDSNVNELLQGIFDFLDSYHGPFKRMTLFKVGDDQVKAKVLSVYSKTGYIMKEGEEIDIQSFTSYPSLKQSELFVMNFLEGVKLKSTTDLLQYNDGVRSYLAKPLTYQNKLIGILGLSSLKENHFTSSIISSFEETTDPLAVALGQAIELGALQQEVEKMGRKNQKTWQMSLAVHKQKEEIEEKIKLIESEKVQLEKEKLKIKKRNERLWETSVAIHKEKERIEAIKVEIEEKHKNITDSISYAQRIQEALLPSTEIFSDAFSDYFILFKPRDVVSGDFFWAYQTDDNKIIWAAADCTGHGVPGAFMSMISISLLNKIVIEQKEFSPDEILNQLRKGIISALTQKGSYQRDGLDITLTVFDKVNKTLEFTGANNPLIVCRKGELIEFKVQKQPVGYYEVQEPFKKQFFQLEENDMIFSFTDGYHDQFGGPEGKKYKTKPFKNFLNSISTHTGKIQKTMLESEVEGWMGRIEQVDDICVIGVRI